MNTALTPDQLTAVAMAVDEADRLLRVRIRAGLPIEPHPVASLQDALVKPVFLSKLSFPILPLASVGRMILWPGAFLPPAVRRSNVYPDPWSDIRVGYWPEIVESIHLASRLVDYHVRAAIVLPPVVDAGLDIQVIRAVFFSKLTGL